MKLSERQQELLKEDFETSNKLHLTVLDEVLESFIYLENLFATAQNRSLMSCASILMAYTQGYVEEIPWYIIVGSSYLISHTISEINQFKHASIEVFDWLIKADDLNFGDKTVQDFILKVTPFLNSEQLTRLELKVSGMEVGPKTQRGNYCSWETGRMVGNYVTLGFFFSPEKRKEAYAEGKFMRLLHDKIKQAKEPSIIETAKSVLPYAPI